MNHFKRTFRVFPHCFPFVIRLLAFVFRFDFRQYLFVFAEHMLFLGTEKYPDEKEYGNFLQAHGGLSNAWTDKEHTNYYFDVNTPHFQGALDR